MLGAIGALGALVGFLSAVCFSLLRGLCHVACCASYKGLFHMLRVCRDFQGMAVDVSLTHKSPGFYLKFGGRLSRRVSPVFIAFVCRFRT